MTDATQQPPPKSRLGLPIWVVYDHPRDFPSNYVARLFYGEEMTDMLLVCSDLERLRDEINRRGQTVKLMRSPGDDPVILETWI